MRRLPTLLLAGALVPLALPAGADAMVQPDRGIAGARLGNSRAEVRAALGSPASVRRGRNDFGPYLTYRYRGGLSVTFQGRREVTSVRTTGLGDRTRQGVGVGSNEAEADRVPGVTCETLAGYRTCHTGGYRPGQRVTDFTIEDGKVTRVTVAVVID